MIIKRRVLLVKIESTYRTDSIPVAATDAILVINPSWGFEGLRMNDRPAVRASIASLQKVYGGTLKTVTFDVEVKGSGAAGTPPELGTILRCGGIGETISAGVSVTYAPVSDVSTHESCSLRLYDDGTMHNLLGCQVMALSFARKVGEVDIFSVTMVGHPEALADAALPSPTYDTSKPVAVKGVPFSIDSYAAVIGELNFDLGLTVSMPPDVSKSNGYGQIVITGRELTGSFDPQHTLVATQDWEGKFKAGTVMALDGGTVGTVAGNKHKLTMPGVAYIDIAPGDKDGVTSLENSFQAVETGGTDNEWSLVFS